MLNKTILIVLLLLLSGNVFPLEKANKEVIQKCNMDYSSCDVFIQNNGTLEKQVLRNYPFQSKIEKLFNNNVIIYASCGSPCSVYIFVDVKHNEVESIEMPIHFDKKEQVVVFFDNKKIQVKKPFSDHVMEYEIKDLARTANPVSAIRSVEFIESTKLVVEYLNANYDSTSIEFEYRHKEALR